MNMRDTVSGWDIKKINQALDDWEHLEREGTIDDCVLRTEARLFANIFSMNIVTAMRDLSFECYRALAVRGIMRGGEPRYVYQTRELIRKRIYSVPAPTPEDADFLLDILVVIDGRLFPDHAVGEKLVIEPV